MVFYSVEASFGAAEPRLQDVKLFVLSLSAKRCAKRPLRQQMRALVFLQLRAASLDTVVIGVGASGVNLADDCGCGMRGCGLWPGLDWVALMGQARSASLQPLRDPLRDCMVTHNRLAISRIGFCCCPQCRLLSPLVLHPCHTLSRLLLPSLTMQPGTYGDMAPLLRPWGRSGCCRCEALGGAGERERSSIIVVRNVA
ncbi:hypothetical protein HaLaN_17573 [Haematococcus lacustris]|uniref:Uncharacterized protein n=1 Tax=Haematococcus lacustris TaxID=44745 RepID=A0A699ZLJ1_HAELA|nr:hypothetical protein HaLaN_17573 [Haematococcus lacustris]